MKREPFNPADLDYFAPGEPWPNAPDARAPKKPKFQLTPFKDIKFETADEWLVKKLLPRKGVAAIYGASGSVKTFILLDLLLHVALGWPWARRRVVQAPAIYIAAEGAAGLRKRKIGWELAHDGLPDDVPFHLIEVAPNLGAGIGDLKEVIANIEAAGVRPGAIAIDTVAQSIGAGDENNTGMVPFAANITALANNFGCLVAAVHHVGLGDEKRLRGHSSFLGALDASILSERKEGALSATLTVMKLKDEESAQKFTAHLARVVIGKDSDGEEVSTLIVESVETGATEGAKAPHAKSIPRGQRLLIAVVEQAIGEDETAKMIRPFADGPLVNCIFLAASGLGGGLKHEGTDPIQVVADTASRKIEEAIAIVGEYRRAPDASPVPAAPDAKPKSPAARTNRGSA